MIYSILPMLTDFTVINFEWSFIIHPWRKLAKHVHYAMIRRVSSTGGLDHELWTMGRTMRLLILKQRSSLPTSSEWCKQFRPNEAVCWIGTLFRPQDISYNPALARRIHMGCPKLYSQVGGIRYENAASQSERAKMFKRRTIRNMFALFATLWQFNIVRENGLLIMSFPNQNDDFL